MDRSAIDGVGRAHHGGSRREDVVDFSANTNPLVPPGTLEVYRNAFERCRRYPNDPATAFRTAAAAVVECSPEAVVPTAGGMEAIRLAIAVAVEPGDTILLPTPSFAEYEREVRLQGGVPEPVDEAAILEADPEGHALAVVCTPNNPTGRGYDETALRSFADRCDAAGTTLLVDEAFLGFTDRVSLAGRDGVVVARSLTKLYGLPGLRLGYAVATGTLGERLETARRPWNVGVPALAVGTHCLGHEAFVAETRERVRSERERMRSRLAEHFTVSPSVAPFLLLDVGDRSVDAILETCLAAGVAIRDARTFPGLERHVRVAVRLPDENDRLLEVLIDV